MDFKKVNRFLSVLLIASFFFVGMGSPLMAQGQPVKTDSCACRALERRDEATRGVPILEAAYCGFGKNAAATFNASRDFHLSEPSNSIPRGSLKFFLLQMEFDFNSLIHPPLEKPPRPAPFFF